MAVVFVFSLIHQALACALEHNDSPPGMRKDFSHGLLLCLSRLLSQWHWILGQNLFKWCFIREQENWKLKSCRAVSKSTRCAFTTSKYLHWPRSAWKPVSTYPLLHPTSSAPRRAHFLRTQPLGTHFTPTHLPGFLREQPESPSLQHTPPCAFTH